MKVALLQKMPEKTTLNVQISVDTDARLDRYMRATGIKKYAIVENALRRYLDENSVK
jgi:predicted transcriptional regulator